MLLRESGRKHGISVNMMALTQAGADSGVPDGDVLIAFANAVTGTDPAALDAARTALEDRMGPNALVEAAVIAANFSLVDRIANAIGIPMEGSFVEATADFRAEVGINDFLSARNTLETVD